MAKKIQENVEELVYLERKQATPYTVNYKDVYGNITPYKWIGATPKKPSIKGVPTEVFEWLKSTAVFSSGRLVIAEQPQKEEFVEEVAYEIGVDKIPEVMSIGEAEDILNLPIKTFKTKIESLTKANLEMLIDVAIKNKIDSDSKKTAIAKTLGIDKDLIFPIED